MRSYNVIDEPECIELNTSIHCEDDAELLDMIYDNLQKDSFAYCESDSKFVCKSVKGRLKEAVKQWSAIHASEFIIQTIQLGYKIPFITSPTPFVKHNNKSAYEHGSFVDEAILDLLSDARVEEVYEKPEFVNPLSVSVQSSGKKRLILDLRHINLFIYKQKFKCEDLNTLREMSKPGDFFFSFDLKSGYHHLDIFPEHRKFLSFSWCLNNCTHARYFQFTVLPFGLTSAPFIFTKLLRPVVSYWRAQGIPVVVYLDDGIGCCGDFDRCATYSSTVRTTLLELGFVFSEEKCLWPPSTRITWLGCVIDSNTGIIQASQRRIHKLQNLLDNMCDSVNKPSSGGNIVHVKSVASIVGSIISLGICCGTVTRIMSRYLHFIINSRESWNSLVVLDCPAQRELLFWKLKLKAMNGIPFWKTSTVPVKVVYSDASGTGCGAHVNFDNRIFQANWSEAESAKSSTWRELAAVKLALSSYIEQMKGSHVAWYTDNQNVVTIIECGSKVRELQDLALDIYVLCSTNKVCVTPVWIPRDMNCTADCISKTIDFDDYMVKMCLSTWTVCGVLIPLTVLLVTITLSCLDLIQDFFSPILKLWTP
jgi:hypothetical protein